VDKRSKEKYNENLRCPACDRRDTRYIVSEKMLRCRKCGCEWRHDPMVI